MSLPSSCDVSVIIVNYNTEDLLADCLDSIFAQTTGLEYEVIVVDNASTDGSRRRVREGYPDVILLESPENLGFGRANNLGAKAARGRYLFLLNSDTRLLNNALKLFFAYCEAGGERLGVVGSWLRGRHGLIVNSHGAFPTFAACVRDRIMAGLSRKKDTDRERGASRPVRVDFVTGADMFMSKELFLSQGGFDEDFFMYYEETELQRRISRAGYRHVLIPDPRILHLEEGSKKSRMASRIMMETSMYRYFAKTRGPSLGLHCFAIFYTFLSLFPNLGYPPRDFLLFYRSLRKTLPSILMGKATCSL